MQFLSSLIPKAPGPGEPGFARREKPAGAHLPYARHVDDFTLETRDGLLMQTIHLKFRGHNTK